VQLLPRTRLTAPILSPLLHPPLLFLSPRANKAKEGVVTLASGLQYKVLRKGDGSFYPTKDSSCECHYEGTLIDGTEFDSSYARGTPTSFAPNQVISGWTEAMQLMVEGDKWEMYIPSDMAYGERGSPPKIPGGSALIFRMEIIKIKGDKVAANRCDVATLEGCD
jgi:FKBP-type peptidyl-prolyl cis-trans isomerase FklB